jgi:signal transduction histidine kinase
MTEKAEGYTVSYEYDMSQDLPKELKYCIISIVKEALSNVTRHSDADRVKLLLREHPAFYQILIQDNGKCVHPGDGTGIGITNMRQRVETFGGTIDIRTENGYRIFIHIPKADIPAGR